MIEGKCKKCGARYYGWALQFRRNHSCPECDGALDIYKDGQLIAKGYPLCTAEKFSIDVKFDSRAFSKNAEKN